MKAAGFGGVFCNIGDASGPDKWSDIRQAARDQGMFCGPWLRTADANHAFDADRLAFLLETADAWGSPLIVNSEKELDGSGDDLTSYIAAQVGEREAAFSMEPVPFASCHWYPLAHLPVLPQIFPAEQSQHYDPVQIRSMWWNYGVKCVYPTFGSYGGMQPTDFNLQAPYSIYTGDDCAYDYASWSPTHHGWEGCQEAPTPPDGGSDMEKIGNQDGIVAATNRIRDLDPGGTLLVKGADGKWPDISTLPPDKSKWKAYDKLQRTLQILKDDHDGAD
jgi:hypothetical protein